MGVCSVDGCDLKHSANGYCRKHDTRMKRNGSTMDRVSFYENTLNAELTQGDVEFLFEYNKITGVFTWRKRDVRMFHTKKMADSWNKKHAGKTVGYKAKRKNVTYLQVGINKKRYYIHRLAWLYHYGSYPVNEIDHINGDGLDNSITNLRDVGRAENCKNTKLNTSNKTGFHGVGWSATDGKWRVSITVNKKHIHLGFMSSFSGAVKLRKAAEEKHGFHANHGRI